MRVVEGAKHCSLEGVLLGEAETDALSAAVGLIDREALGLLVGYICLKEARELVFKRDALEELRRTGAAVGDALMDGDEEGDDDG